MSHQESPQISPRRSPRIRARRYAHSWGVRWVELSHEPADPVGMDGLLGLRVHLGWVGAVTGVAHEQPLPHGLLEHEGYVVVDLVHVGAAGLSSREGAALHHGHVHLVEDGGRHVLELHVADVAAGCLELPLLLVERGLGDLLLCTAHVEVASAVLLEGEGGAALDPVVLDLVDELAQGGLGLVVRAAEHARLAQVLPRLGVEPKRDAELPLAALVLGLVLLELDYGVLAGYLLLRYG